MMEDIENIEEKFISGHFKKSIEDKLTYKNIIADAINWCRKRRGYKDFDECVQGLEDIISFRIEGYDFRNDLKEIKGEIGEELKKREEREIEKLGRRFYKRANKAKFRIKQHKWYWNSYFKEIIQLLAEHNLLFDKERTIPYKQLGRLTHGEKVKRKGKKTRSST